MGLLNLQLANNDIIQFSNKFNFCSKFDINDHVIVHSETYRNRPITDWNIQEYVSTIIAKFMPADKPQWQFIIIPTGLVNNVSVVYIMYIIL